MKVFVRDLIEHLGVEDELSSEGTIKFRVVWPVIGSGNILDVPAGIFVGEDESVSDVIASMVGSFAFDKWGN